MEEPVQAPVKKSLSDSDVIDSRQGWIEKHAELIAKLEAEYQQPQQVNDQSLALRFYTFSIAGVHLLIPNNIFSEVIEYNTIYPIPLAPNWLLGACNVRGDIVPVVDLYKIASGDAAVVNINNCTTLVLDKGEHSYGFVLDKLPSSILFKDKNEVSDYSKVPDSLKPFISTAYKRNNRLYVCIDFPSLIKSFTN